MGAWIAASQTQNGLGAGDDRNARSRLRLSVVILTFGAAVVGCASQTSSTSPTASRLVPTSTAWFDEFDGPANSLPDPTKWTYDLGNNGGWGNQELETYTNSTENVHLDGQGHLVIHVESTPTGFTSARLKTQGLFAAQYGSIQARIKVPTGDGIWPAFWILGTSFNGSNWPQCGEIDIMENIGSQPSVNLGSLHGPGYSGGSAISSPYTLPGGQRFTDSFHTFAIRWAPQSVTFSVDGITYRTVTPASLPTGAPWVFDAPFFLLMNVAVGGGYPGPPDATTRFPQDMLVDYVRYTLWPAPTGGSKQVSGGS